MNLLRKIKINLISPVIFTDDEQKIIKLFDYWLKDLTVFIDDDYPHEINYMSKEGLFVLQQDDKLNTLYIRYSGFWRVLSKYDMDYVDIQNLMKGIINQKFILERPFKKKVYTSMIQKALEIYLIEKSFKELSNKEVI